MTRGKSDSYWPGADERLVVEEMIRDPKSPYWEECSQFVERRVFVQAKNMPGDYQGEISQEVMEKITKSLPTFHFQSGLKTWLNAIVKYHIIDTYDRWQKQKANVSLDDPPNGSDLEGGIIAASETRSETKAAEVAFFIKDDLQNAVDALREYTNAHSNPIRDRLIIQMVIFDGLAYKEVAEAVGCNSPVVGHVVREAQSYARKKLEHML